MRRQNGLPDKKPHRPDMPSIDSGAAKKNRRAASEGASEARIRAILKYIEENHSRKLNLHDLSGQFYLSESYLSQYIKARLGVSFLECLNNIRLEHALSDMSRTEHSLTQIAYDHGFSSLAAFHRSFCRKYAMTPSLYRQMLSSDARKNPDDLYKECTPGRLIRESVAFGDAKQWEYCGQNGCRVLNLGAAEDLQLRVIREHILLLKSGLNFQYGRIWSLFCRENLVDVHTNGPFNFSVLDEILDFLVRHEITPMINLGLKPKKIVRPNLQRVMLTSRKQDATTLKQHQRMLTEFIEHIISRYGKNNVAAWIFELWQEVAPPDAAGDFNAWEALPKMQYACIKSLLPDAKVGGMGFNIYDGHTALKRFLEEHKHQKEKLDFISVSIYPYRLANETDGDGPAAKSPLVPDENFIGKELTAIGGLLQAYGEPPEKLWVTEWNQSISSRSYLNDTCYKGAYIVKNLCDSLHKTCCMAYWASTDAVDEYFDSVACFYGGGGLLSRDGIPKPAFYALQFMSRLAPRLLSVGENYVITADGQDGYVIVCHNLESPDFEYYLKEDSQEHPQDVFSFFHQNERCIHFYLDNVKEGEYRLRKYYINSDKGSAFDAWARLDFMANTGPEEIRYLNAVAIAHMMSHICTSSGQLCFDTYLKANEIQLICLNRTK